nr:hypothetical protein [Tenacibaculum sp.]
MKKVFLLTISIMLFSNIIFAQENNRDVVYLKNGSIIKGYIIEQVPNKTMTIQTIDGSTFVYPIDEIKKITKEISHIPNNINKIKSKKINTNRNNTKNNFNYYSFNAGAGNSLRVNLAELNFAGNSGWGGILKLGGSWSFHEDMSLYHLAIGPSYSFSAGSTVGTVTLMTGVGLLKYESERYEYNNSGYKSYYHTTYTDTIFLYGLGYTHRFFTDKK